LWDYLDVSGNIFSDFSLTIGNGVFFQENNKVLKLLLFKALWESSLQQKSETSLIPFKMCFRHVAGTIKRINIADFRNTSL